MARALKILMVSETLPARQLGGLAKHALTLANTLIEEGHEVTVLGLAGTFDEASRLEMGFKGPVICALDFMPGWKEGPLGCFNPFKRPYYAQRMARTITAHAQGFDVVHYHGNLPLVAEYIPPHINFAQTRHDQGSECLIHVRFRAHGVCNELDPAVCAGCATSGQPNAVQTLVSASAVRRYRDVAAKALARHKTIFVSEAIRRNAGRVLPPAAFARSHVIHNFINQALIARETEGVLPVSNDRWEIVIASRLDEAKGVGQFLSAWRRAAGNTTHAPVSAHITVAGDGPMREQITQAHSGPGITFLKHQSYASTLQLTARAHVAVVPSQCEESCSTTTLEALAIGRHCFALRRGGTPEMLGYQRWPGQLQLFDDIEALVAGLCAHLQSPPTVFDALPAPSAAAMASDVRAILPHILDVYEQA